MKKINLRGLQSVLSEKELKNVLGGSGWDHANDKCISTNYCDPVTGEYDIFNAQCFYGENGAKDADDYAGPDGWWCCNCDEIYKKCY